MSRGLLLIAFLLSMPGPAPAQAPTPAEAPATWPPTPELLELLERMRELQATLSDARSTPEERRAARAELMKLLRSPEAAPVDPDKPRPARAAVPPMPASGPVRTNPPSDLPAPPVAIVTPLPRTPEPVIDPVTGKVLVPAGKAAVDPATGGVLQQVPGGYLDPRTGRIVPRP